MKKKVAFILADAVVGGVETAFIYLLNSIDIEKYDISIFTNREGNPCIGRFPDKINVYYFDEMSLKPMFYRSLKKGHFLKAIELFFNYIKLRLSNTELQKTKFSRKHYHLSDEYFDCAISYKHDYASVYDTLFHIKAAKKAVWIHGKLLGGNTPQAEYLHWLSMFDMAYCVSDVVKENFTAICPSMKGNIQVFHNIIFPYEVIEKSMEPCNLVADNKIKILTVGRLGVEKGQDMIPRTALLLLNAGYNISWYIIGSGTLREKIEKEINKLGLSHNVFLLGTQRNPYPYMRSCDVYVQTSYSEGWCLTVQEAKILCKPVVTTDLPVMRDQFTHMENGYITKGISPEALFEGIKTLLDYPELCDKFVQNLSKETHDNTNELYKLYEFIEN